MRVYAARVEASALHCAVDALGTVVGAQEELSSHHRPVLEFHELSVRTAQNVRVEHSLGLSLEETPAFIRNLIETDEESEEAFAANCRMLDRKHMRRAYPLSPTGDYMKEKN